LATCLQGRGYTVNWSLWT